MSLPEDEKHLKEIYKPFLKYHLGDVVYLKNDIEQKYPMTITNFDLDDYNCDDYYVSWINSQGKEEHSKFPEECLTQLKI